MLIQEILKEKIIERGLYMNQIEKYIGVPIIKVIIGQRRVWKSSILKSFIQKLHLSKTIPEENIFYVNKELMRFDHIKGYNDLKESFYDFLQQKKEWKVFVWIDEIQEIDGWEKFINGLLAEFWEEIEIFISGSNSFLLSSELATYLTGRYIEFQIYPLSFSEFAQFGDKEKSESLFYEYLKYGWMPAIFKMEYSEEIIYPYLNGVYNTIMIKDILSRHSIKNIVFFKDLYKYTISNIGNIISAISIKKYLRSQNVSLGNDTVLHYLQYAQDVFLLNKVYSCDPTSKKYFEIYNKYYVSDLWLRNSIVWYDFKRDIGSLIENYVYLELKRKKYEVKVWRFSNEKEIDFIAEKWWRKIYLQVAYTMKTESTLTREYASLKLLKDNWAKYVVTLDSNQIWPHEGIEHIYMLDLEDVLL